jgi:hypothetical protein
VGWSTHFERFLDAFRRLNAGKVVATFPLHWDFVI